MNTCFLESSLPGWRIEYLPSPEPINQLSLRILFRDQPLPPFFSWRCTQEIDVGEWIPLKITLFVETLTPAIAAQVGQVPIPLGIDMPLCDPALLHMAQLLRTELEAPQCLNQVCVTALMVVLLTHVLQVWQQEHLKTG